MPVWVEFSTSTDGKTFTSRGHIDNDIDPQDYTCQIREFSLPLKADARYVKVVAKNFGVLPEWHLGAGGLAHIFVDEVTIK